MNQTDKSLSCQNKFHIKDNTIVYLHVKDSKEEQPNFLMCQNCTVDQNFETNSFLIYNHCINCDENAVISNWPPQIDCNLIKRVKELTSQDKKKIILSQIEAYFSNLEQQIKEKISDKKKKILIEYDKFNLNSQSLIQVYNKVAEKEKFKEILQYEESNNENLNKQLQKFFSEKINKSKECIKEIQDWINLYDKQENKIKFEQAESIKNITSSLIENIQFIFDDIDMQKKEEIKLDINQLDEKTLVQFFINFQIKNTEIKKKYITYLQDFQNQTYQLNAQFNNLEGEMKQKYRYARIQQMERIEQMLQDSKKNTEILKMQKYDLDLVSNDKDGELKQQKIDEIMKVIEQLNKLKLNQIKDIEILSEKIAYLTNNKDYLEAKEIQESILPLTSYICNIMKLEQPYSSLYQQRINDILKQYPIFELSKIEKYKPIEFNMQHSTYSQSTSFTFRKEKNSISILSNGCTGTVYSDFVLENNKKYIVRFKFNQAFHLMTTLHIGLIKENCLNTNLGGSAAALYTNSQSGLEQAKNAWLYSTTPPYYDQLNEIEMRVCIDDNTLVFTDYPHYKSYNFKLQRNQSGQKMDQSQKWRIGVYMDSGSNKVVTVHSLVEVNELPVI